MLKPLGEFMIIRRDPADTKKGVLFIPDAAQEPPRSGNILAIGPGNRSMETGVLIETTLKVGERVLFGPYGGVEVGLVVDGAEEKFLMLKESEIFGVFEPE